MGLRLGLLTTARINARVVEGAKLAEDVEVAAVGGRDSARAHAHAREHGIPHSHGSYEGLLADEDVDAVYIALPNALHAEWTVRALEAGKHVLVEKPFTTDPALAEHAFDVAERRGLVLTEGFMWRHGPQAAKVSELVRDGAVGKLRAVRAQFSFVLDRTGDVREDPALGGGSLLDVGTYCVNAARLLAGEPEEARALARIGDTGVDVHVGAAMRHPGGVLSLLDCGFDTVGQGLQVAGSEGTLRLADPWHGRQPVIEIDRGGAIELLELEPRNQYAAELDDLAAAVTRGRPTLIGRDDAVGQARALRMILDSAGIAPAAA